MKKYLMLLFLLFGLIQPMPRVLAATAPKMVDDDGDVQARMALFTEMEARTGMPWYYLAAIDQFERSMQQSDKDLPAPTGVISLSFSDAFWCGVGNPNRSDTNLISIGLFAGAGVDGDGDGTASRMNDRDLLATMIQWLAPFGFDKEHFKLGLWNYYHRDRSVSLVMNNARLFEKHGTVALQKKVFPLPPGTDYSYRDTWGGARGWGGRRSHEGTDLFAHYGLPVRSTCYGVVELKGWNKFGGWRVGIRDINNSYHYYAHLNSFAKGLEIGQLVEPGQVIGGVGSSGYGKKGTSGKFPPHLHYGLYKYNGRTEWAFNPYPFLQRWEKVK